MRKAFIIIGVIFSAVMIGLIAVFSYLQINSSSIREKLLMVVNDQLNVPVSAEKLEIVILEKFPNVSLRLNNVLIESTLDSKESDTLLFCKNLYIEFGLISILQENIILRSISAYEGKLNLKWGADGDNNYNIFKGDSVNSNAYIDLKSLTLMNTEITMEGLKESSLHYKFIAKRIKLAGVLDQSAINANANWEIYVPNWNEQSIFISGSTDFYSNAESKNIEVKNGQLDLNGWKLKLDGTIEDDQGNWTAKAKNLDMSEVIKLLPKDLIPDSKTVIADGNLDLELKANTTVSGTHLSANGKWTNGYINANDSYFIGSDINADITFDNGRFNSKESSSISIKNISCQSLDTELSGSLHLSNFNSPKCKAVVQFDSKWMDLMHWLSYSTWEGSDGELKGKIEWSKKFKSLYDLRSNGIWGGEWKGLFSIPTAALRVEGANNPTLLSDLEVQLKGYDLEILKGSIQTLDTKAKVKGIVKNVFNDIENYYKFQITGGEWKIEDVIDWGIWNADFTGSDNNSFESSYEFALAANRFTLNDFSGTDVKSTVKGKGLNAKTDDFFIRHSGGTISSSIEWRELNDGSGQLRIDGGVKKVELKEIFRSFNNFDQNHITDKNLSGILDSRAQIRIDFDPSLNILPEKIIADIEFNIENGRLLDFETLKALKRFSEVDKLTDVKFSPFTNRVRIANEVVIIPEMILENNALTLKIAGTHSFENYMDFLIKMQLRNIVGNRKQARSKDLDEFIKEKNQTEKVWIPITVKGPAENLKFSIDAKKISEDLKSNLKNDWKKQSEDLKSIFQKGEKLKKEEPEYEFQWEEEPDTNRLFIESLRSFNKC